MSADATGAGSPPAITSVGARAGSLRDVLAAYARAVDASGAPAIDRIETAGTLAGAGLAGSFHTWRSGSHERTDQQLGPRFETTVRDGDRVWFADADGDVREFTGVLARRARTEALIESGAFASTPERCRLVGRAALDGAATAAVDVTAPSGETETVFLDAASGLPRRIAYDDDDGRTTIDLSDWRWVDGHRFPFAALISDGDRAYDTLQRTTMVDVRAPIAPAVFAPLAARRIAMSGTDAVPLQSRDGHLYVPVTLAGKTYAFVLDSGAQTIVVDKHVADAAGLDASGTLEASGATRTGGMQVARVAELGIGRGMLHDLVVTTLDLGAATGGALHADGILGYPFFAAATVRIDAGARTLTFGPPGSLPAEGARVALSVDRAIPEATFRLDDRLDAPFVVDTGNAAELLLYKPFVDAHPALVPFSTASRRTFGIGGAAPSYRTQLDRIDLGRTALYRCETDVMLATRGAFADRFDAGNVGLGLLKRFVVTFDVAGNALYLDPGARFDDGRART